MPPNAIVAGIRAHLRLAALWLLLAAAPGAWAAGFEYRLPADQVNVLSTRRNNIFFPGERIFFQLEYQSGYPNAATRYDIRDYEGNVIESGPITGAYLSPLVTRPGWYKVNLRGTPVYLRQQGDPPADPDWGDSVGGTMFVIFRNTPGFPAVPPQGTTNGTEGLSDNPMRGIVGSGPQRHRMNADNPAATIANRTQDVAQEKTYYTPYDPYRNRNLLGAFPDSTANRNGVRTLVQAFRNDIKIWEPRNEPNYGASGASFKVEMQNFHEDVHAMDLDGSLKVIGPGTVTIAPGSHGLGFIQDFFNAGGGAYLDGVSFHVYNNFNGDLFMARRSMDGLVNLLAQYGQQNKERWQTEQGFAAALNGSYQPRLQTRWTMLMLMVLEQYGVPKERNYLFYDRNGGFFDVPVWWVNADGTLNPLACLLRVWSEELYGTRFSQHYDFGTAGNKLYLASHFTGPGKQVAVFMSAGSTDGQVRLQVSAPSVQVVSAFGVERVVPAQGGFVLLPVTELPTYVRFTGTLSVVPQNWGANLALGKAVTSTVMGPHPSDSSIINSPSKVTNGEFENWYYLQTQETKVWVDGSFSFPAWVVINFAQPTTMDRVVLYSGVPWQWDGTLLDYDLQYDVGGNWVTLQSNFEPTRTHKTFTPTNRTTVDSYFSDRWVFSHSFPPITTSRLRLWVRDVTYGGGANLLVQQAGGQTGLRLINLREVEAFLSGTQDMQNQAPFAGNDAGSTNQEGVDLRVLANDGDPDGWPQPLRLAHAGPAANGTVAIVGDKVRYIPNWGYSGNDSFTYSVTDGLRTATATVNVAATFTSPPRASGWVNLKAEYYGDQTFTNLVATNHAPGVINYFKEWTQPAPYPGMDPQNFAIRWTGQIKAPYSGAYTFTTYSDDRARLWIDNQLVIDDWVPHSPFHARKVVYLDGGRIYDLRVDYTEGGGNSVMQFLWSHALQPTEAIVPLAPMEVWRRSVFNSAQLGNPSISGRLATPAQDGLTNELKYAFRLAPFTAVSNSTALPQTSVFLDSGRLYLALTYRKNIDATDLTYAVRISDNLAGNVWDDIYPPEEILGYDGPDPIIRRRVDVTGSSRKFIRLEVR